MTEQEPEAKLLVVDDNAENRDLLKRRLERKGYEITLAEDGPEALEAIAQQEFDGVLLDIMMPRMSGTEVLQVIRETKNKVELPVIMATAKTGSEDMVEAFRLGANDYVTKPLEFPIVLARLESHLTVKQDAKAVAPEPAPTVIAIGDFLPAGTVLNKAYRIECTIGEGGFAIVYQATQISTGQAVALKLLRADRLHPEHAETELARFDLEMKVIGRSSHHSVVRLIDSGTVSVKKTPSVSIQQHDKPAATLPAYTPVDLESVGVPSDEMRLPFLVMELLTGETLDTAIRRSPLPVEEAVDLLCSVVDGVHSLHEDGIVHRDLKPSNIFLNHHPNGRILPKVLDFGLAKLTRDADQGWTKTNIVGTPQYIAPEQIRRSEINAKADQHALGVILYEMLAGVPPYEGDNDLQVLQSVNEGKTVMLSSRAPHVPRDLEMAIFRAMATSPMVRFADLLEFHDAILPFASEDYRMDAERSRLRSGVMAPEGLAKTVQQD